MNGKKFIICIFAYLIDRFAAIIEITSRHNIKINHSISRVILPIEDSYLFTIPQIFLFFYQELFGWFKKIFSSFVDLRFKILFL